MKILYITSLSGRRINSFMKSAIIAARKQGYEFTIACNMENADTILYAEDCASYGINVIHIDFERNPLSKKNIVAAKQLLSVMKKNHYDVVHCNTPVGGLVGRICAALAKIPYVIYQAHGFHFWKGAPLKNWLLYYPVEYVLAFVTNLLITINHEDYIRALKFRKVKACYVPGVGIDLSKFGNMTVERAIKRKEIGLQDDDFVLLSVGELIERKNHKVVLRAIASIKDTEVYHKIHYFICGNGSYEEQLKKLCKALNIEKHVHFLGFRSDIAELCMACDQYIFMSFQEGLAIALMEAMASGIPIICSPIRGNMDLVEHKVTGYVSDNTVFAVANAIQEVIENRELYLVCADKARVKIQEFSIEKVIEDMTRIYAEAARVIMK